jgi:hypothetical protein
MAKDKSTPGTRTSRTNAKKDQASAVNPVSVTDGTVVEAGTTTAEVVATEVKAAEVKPTPEPRKLEMVKTEPRKNVVIPIKLEEEIRRRAYEIFVQRGRVAGSEAEDWLTAEREVRQRYQKQHSA